MPAGFNNMDLPEPQSPGFAEFFMQMRQQQAAQDAQRANMLLQRDQLASLDRDRTAQRGIQQQQVGMQAKAFEQAQSERTLEAKTKITAALDAGRPDLAKQIASTFNIPLGEIAAQDPRDTLMKPSLDARQAPEMGPQATPEIAMNAAMRRAEAASFEPNAGPDSQYAKEALDERSRFEQAQSPTTLTPQGLMVAKGGKYNIAGQEYDPEEVRRSQQAKIDANSQRFAGAMGGIGGLDKYIPVYQAGVTAGLSPEKSFELMQKRMESDETRESREENARLQREQSDVNNRRIAGAMSARPAMDMPFKQAAADRGEEAAIDAITGKVFGQMGFKEVQVSNRKFNDMATQLTHKNAASDAVTAGSFVKMAQGGTGVVSDNDMEAFWNRIGGVTTRSAEWVSKVLSGQISPEKREIVSQAVKELAGRAQSNKAEIRENLKFRLDNSAFSHRRDDVLGTYFPEERSKIEDARAIDRAKNSTRSNRIKGGGRDRLDDDLDNL